MGGEKLKKRIFFTAVIIAANLFIHLHPVYSQEAAEPESTVVLTEDELPIGEDAPALSIGGASSVFAIFRMILVLALAAAAVYGLVFFLKKASRPRPQQDPYLKLVSSVSLGSNRFVHIVMIGTKAWLVGAADGGVNLLSPVEDQELLASMLAAGDDFPQNRTVFNFKALLGKMGAAMDSRVPSPQDIRRRRDRLREAQP
ncbi:MAG: flagellar biosynthetic protein FliO [Treponema sp.]|nr:flagellar biosynthetic protein FliO [Treponema sp.]